MTKNDFAVREVRVALSAISAGRLGLANESLLRALRLLGFDDEKDVDEATLGSMAFHRLDPETMEAWRDGGHK